MKPRAAKRCARSSYVRRKPSAPLSSSSVIGALDVAAADVSAPPCGERDSTTVGRYTPSVTAFPVGAGAQYHSFVPGDSAPAGGAMTLNAEGGGGTAGRGGVQAASSAAPTATTTAIELGRILVTICDLLPAAPRRQGLAVPLS